MRKSPSKGHYCPQFCSHFVTSMTAPIASGWSGAGWGLHPLESAAFARRTPKPEVTAHLRTTVIAGWTRMI